MMDYVQYDYSYMFFYSERPGTLAARKLEDDIPLEVKKRRLEEIIEKQRETLIEPQQARYRQSAQSAGRRIFKKIGR